MPSATPSDPAPAGPPSDPERWAWLALARLQPTPRQFRTLLESFPSLSEAFRARPARLEQLGLPAALVSGLADPDEAAVEADLRWLEAPDHHLLRLTDRGYPEPLRELPDAPPVLFLVGDPECLRLPQLAVVGSRNPTAGGLEVAQDFAQHLAAAGLTITSGMALGIDGAAHRGALAAGGFTVAVCGTGLDRVYPARHRELAHEIAGHGVLVSEFPLGTPPLPQHFPRRNRIISGLGLGVLVVEASLRSGSLTTARLALEQGRDVFAIPGSIHNPLSKGCHWLIRQGAKLTECVADILEELPGPLTLPPSLPESPPATTEPLDPDYRRVLDGLGHDPVPADLIVQRTGLTPAVVSSILLVLELQGYVTAAAGGRYARTGKKDG